MGKGGIVKINPKSKTGKNLQITEIAEQNCTRKEWVEVEIGGINGLVHPIEVRMIQSPGFSRRYGPLAGIRIRNLPKDVFITLCRGDDGMYWNEERNLNPRKRKHVAGGIHGQNDDIYLILWKDKRARHTQNIATYWPHLPNSELFVDKPLKEFPRIVPTGKAKRK
jgi:hypothetical protein